MHTWLLRYRREGIAGLEDRSHRVQDHPWRIAAGVEELVCELRRVGTAMELWQLDVTASTFLTSAAEVKIVTGVDDHSRFCVIAKAVMRATARPGCQAFVDAMRHLRDP